MLCVNFSPAADAPAGPIFTDVTQAAGVFYVQSSTDPELMQYRMSGGAAAGDYDGDGWIDLYVTRFDRPDILFRNRGDGTFEDVSDAAFGGTVVMLRSNGAAWGDFDNDGDPDLYITGYEEGRFFLFNNNGDGTFSEVAQARGAAIEGDDQHYGFGVAIGDYDRDGFLDIYTSDWVTKWQNPNDSASRARLLHNRGTAQPGYFDDVTEAAGVSVDQLHPHGDFAFSPRFTDLDGDRWPDLAIVSDFTTSRLFWNNGDGTFTDGTKEANVGTDRSGMGSTIGDYDGDGDLDWFVASISDPWDLENGNRLYRNEGGRVFSDQTDAAGVRFGQWGWGTSFLDYDNDGDLDLIMTNGMSGPFGTRTPSYLEDPMHLWRNDGGTFTDVSSDAGITDTRQGRGLLVFDFDRDGDLDVFVANNGQDGPLLYRNDGGNENDWLRVDTVGTVSNRDGIGALITVTPDLTNPDQFMIREVDGGSNYLGQNELEVHFGLGPTRENDLIDLVTIQWPSGVFQEFTDIRRNSTLLAVEPVPEPSTWVLAICAAWALSLATRGRRLRSVIVERNMMS